MSHTTQTVSAVEDETDVTMFLSPYARARLDMWRRGELEGEEPPEDTVTEKKGCATCKLATVNVSDSGSLQPGIVPTTTAPATTVKGG